MGFKTRLLGVSTTFINNYKIIELPVIIIYDFGRKMDSYERLRQLTAALYSVIL